MAITLPNVPLMSQFIYVTIRHVAHGLNSKPDALAGVAVAMAVPEGSQCESVICKKETDT